ncbi:unnamed protein product [Arabis nemorensis]|uniref:Uncharacterized protein n=1 Tax=Arabis nemorensis TaxID=586526 RepID=A0A565CL10_9BRAS|nr:unnamed protein product [Arabis nemorensis]
MEICKFLLVSSYSSYFFCVYTDLYGCFLSFYDVVTRLTPRRGPFKINGVPLRCVKVVRELSEQAVIYKLKRMIQDVLGNEFYARAYMESNVRVKCCS